MPLTSNGAGIPGTTFTREKDELVEQHQQLVMESEGAIAELHTQVDAAGEARRIAEEKAREDAEERISQVHRKKCELQEKLCKKEGIIRAQREQSVMRDSIHDLRQQKDDYRECQDEWRRLAEERKEEN